MDEPLLETVLSAKDIEDQVTLRCLACRRDLASIRFVERWEGARREKKIGLTRMASTMTNFKALGATLELSCQCGTRSRYHMI